MCGFLEEMPILYLDVNLGAEEKTRLVIYENDRPDELARQFALEHSKRVRVG